MKYTLLCLLKPIKRMSVWGAILVGIALLLGCGVMVHRTSYQPLSQRPRPDPCSTASLFITNLTADAQHRHYQLPNGRTCLENPHDQDAQQQKSTPA